MKTRVQGLALEPKQMTNRDVLRTIWNENGLGGFYKGFIARGVRLTAAMFILNMTKSKMEELLDGYKGEEAGSQDKLQPV
jgi:hypothetical protein